MNIKNNKLNITGIVLGIVLAFAVSTIFRACSQKEDGKWMNCHLVQRLLMWIGIGVAVLSFSGIFAKHRTVKLLLCGAELVLAMVGLILPGIILPMCMLDTMRCRAVMAPFSRIMCILFFIVIALQVRKCKL